MRKNYKFREFDLKYAPLMIELDDPPYFPEDLFEMMGSKDFVGTFTFKNDSNSQNRFGEMATGTIFYPRGERDKILRCIRDEITYDNDNVRIITCLPNVDPAIVEELKYGGFPIQDIQSITIVPWKQNEKTEDGNKKIPVIEIPITKKQMKSMDEDILCQNLLVMKLNAEIQLIEEEKAHLIGITLAFNDNSVDKRLLEYLGYSIDDVKNNQSVWYYYNQVKKRRGTITKEEENNLAKNEAMDFAEKVILFSRELTAGHAPGEKVEPSEEQVATIMDSLKQFRPSVIVPIKRQIWWNAESYLHIVLRHVKDFQCGKINRMKTPFPYEFKQLQLLIEKVIETVIDEIKTHFNDSREPKRFHRNGRMSIYFNGDYYALEINSDGLLKSIYIVEQV